MTFNEQVCIEVMKGCFLLLGVLSGGWVVGRSIERFKQEQATIGDIRRRQYEALSTVMAALGVAQNAAERLTLSHSPPEDDVVWTAEERQAILAEWTSALRSADITIRSGVYLIGQEAASAANGVRNHLYDAILSCATAGQELLARDPLDDAFYEKLVELRAPLLALLPPLPSQVRSPE